MFVKNLLSDVDVRYALNDELSCVGQFFLLA